MAIVAPKNSVMQSIMLDRDARGLVVILRNRRRSHAETPIPLLIVFACWAAMPLARAAQTLARPTSSQTVPQDRWL
jgi:hypothetical protein